MSVAPPFISAPGKRLSLPFKGTSGTLLWIVVRGALWCDPSGYASRTSIGGPRMAALPGNHTRIRRSWTGLDCGWRLAAYHDARQSFGTEVPEDDAGVGECFRQSDAITHLFSALHRHPGGFMFEDCFNPMHLLVIFGIALWLWARELPELGRGLGEGLRGSRRRWSRRTLCGQN